MASVRATISDEHERFGGLVAAWSGDCKWNSEADGWSPDAPTTREHLEGVVAYYDDRQSDANLTIAPHLDGGLLPDLHDLGFRLKGVDLQFAIDLGDAALEGARYPEGVLVVDVDLSSEEDVAEWSRLTGVTHFGGEQTDDDIRLDRRVVEHPNTRCLFVVDGATGERVGLGGVEVYDGLACLFMGGVLESHRRRGLQLAMIRQRLHIAREMGAHHAIIGSAPNSPTERNALRAGMRMVFPKLEFVRERAD